MKLWSALLATLLMCAASGGQTAKAFGTNRGSLSYAESWQNEEVILDHIRSALRSGEYAVRIYYAGQCAASDTEYVYFPKIEIHKSIGKGFSAIDNMFHGDSNVALSKEPGRVLSIRIRPNPHVILQTRIPILRLAPLGQYNPNGAIGSLLNTTEVTAEMARLRLRVPLSLSEQLLAQPAQGLPHLPGIMKDMTADQVLDSVAATFKGVVVYGICPEPSGGQMFTVDFFGLQPGSE